MQRPKQYLLILTGVFSMLYKKAVLYTCGVKIIEKYLWWCTFFSKVACWRPAALLNWLLLQVILEDFDHRSRKAFWRTLLFLQNTSCWLILSFKSFTKVFSVFQFSFDSYCTASVRHCVLFPLTLKKTNLTKCKC